MVDNTHNNSEKSYKNHSFTESRSEDGIMKEQDRLVPIANVGRIMKQILPPNAKISKESKETMQECVSEFISFVTGEASDKCHKEKRKTVNGDDICWALGNLGFDEYAEPLKKYLSKYRDQEGERACHKASNSGEEKDDLQMNSQSSGSTPFLKFAVFDKDDSEVYRRY
ncbi:nuclear transcription factor Y subunit B-4 [Mercurialis annua]|uniref:nuclear transcription factor Y subunit B-4 n=1 Tax=Mercurialis annua TaxID=3986 RepID=UPI00215DDFDB|nr:nuclear transcription factor Y subunit B-4 [Mercurialis annua]